MAPRIRKFMTQCCAVSMSIVPDTVSPFTTTAITKAACCRTKAVTLKAKIIQIGTTAICTSMA
jgi:hypothetical protein